MFTTPGGRPASRMIWHSLYAVTDDISLMVRRTTPIGSCMPLSGLVTALRAHAEKW